MWPAKIFNIHTLAIKIISNFSVVVVKIEKLQVQTKSKQSGKNGV